MPDLAREENLTERSIEPYSTAIIDHIIMLVFTGTSSIACELNFQQAQRINKISTHSKYRYGGARLKVVEKLEDENTNTR